MGSFELPMRLTLDGGDYEDVITSLALSRFGTGEEPFAEVLRAERVARAEDLVPLGTVVRHVRDEHVERVLARGGGWSVLVERYRNGHTDVSQSAADAELLAKMVAEVRARCPVVEPAPDDLEVEFWYSDTTASAAPAVASMPRPGTTSRPTTPPAPGPRWRRRR